VTSQDDERATLLPDALARAQEEERAELREQIRKEQAATDKAARALSDTD
jgi:hypothetical protein